jgi:molecular chaperone IbpA
MVTRDLNNTIKYMIGVDNLMNRVSEIAAANQSMNYPPHNLVALDNSNILLEMALAGFDSSEVSVYTENSVLYISGTKPESKERNYLHRGLANRSFKWSRAIPEDSRVESVDFKDGLLSVKLTTIVPEEKKKKVWF